MAHSFEFVFEIADTVSGITVHGFTWIEGDTRDTAREHFLAWCEENYPSENGYLLLSHEYYREMDF